MAKIVLSQSIPEVRISGRTFRIVFSLANEPSSIQKDLLKKLERKIASRYGLFIDRTNPDIEFWFLYRTEGYGFFGLRLTRHPDYKKVLEKGQLRPELANLLCLISEMNKNDVVLDPCAGSGAIALERSYYPYKQIFAGDIDEEVVGRLKDQMRKRVNISKIDTLNLTSFKDHSIDKIITDPPWGISVELKLDLPIFYRKMLDEFARVLKPNSLLVVLIGQKMLFEEQLKAFDVFGLTKKYDILVSGKKAAIYKLIRVP